MNILDKIFRPKQVIAAKKMNEYMKTINAYTPSFTNFSGGIYETELIRSVVHAKAKHTAKLQPNITGSAMSNLKLTLENKPNKFQSTYDFLYRLRTLYEVDTYVFIVPVLSDLMHIEGYYVLRSNRVEIMEYDNRTWLRYTFKNGEVGAIEYDYVGVLSKMNYENEFLGDGNQVLFDTVSLVHLNNQGIKDAIKQSASIRFMAKLGQAVRPEDLKKEREAFTEMNLSNENDTGVMLFDTKYADVKQVESKPFVVDEKQLNLIKNNVFNYFGISEDILQNKFDENTWNAFYEGEIEPFAIQLSMAMTNMTFTVNELSHGNSIHFSSNRLQYASNSTKLQVTTALADRGILGSHAIAEIWNLPKPAEDVYYIRGEYLRKETSNSEDVTKKEKKETDEISKVNYEEVSNDQ